MSSLTPEEFFERLNLGEYQGQRLNIRATNEGKLLVHKLGHRGVDPAIDPEVGDQLTALLFASGLDAKRMSETLDHITALVSCRSGVDNESAAIEQIADSALHLSSLPQKQPLTPTAKPVSDPAAVMRQGEAWGISSHLITVGAYRIAHINDRGSGLFPALCLGIISKHLSYFTDRGWQPFAQTLRDAVADFLDGKLSQHDPYYSEECTKAILAANTSLNERIAELDKTAAVVASLGQKPSSLNDEIAALKQKLIKSPKDYLHRLRTNNDSGDPLTLQAFADCFICSVISITPGVDAPLNIHPSPAAKKGPSHEIPTIAIAHYSTETNGTPNHFGTILG